VYVTTRGDGVLKSDDGGASWQTASHRLDDLDLHEIAVSPSSPEIVLAAANATGYGLVPDQRRGRDLVHRRRLRARHCAGVPERRSRAFAGGHRWPDHELRQRGGDLGAGSTWEVAADARPGRDHPRHRDRRGEWSHGDRVRSERVGTTVPVRQRREVVRQSSSHRRSQPTGPSLPTHRPISSARRTLASRGRPSTHRATARCLRLWGSHPRRRGRRPKPPRGGSARVVRDTDRQPLRAARAGRRRFGPRLVRGPAARRSRWSWDGPSARPPSR
jgi:hypothetical protein